MWSNLKKSELIIVVIWIFVILFSLLKIIFWKISFFKIGFKIEIKIKKIGVVLVKLISNFVLVELFNFFEIIVIIIL